MIQAEIIMNPAYKIGGIRVRKSRGRGRGVFATKLFKKGEVIEISPVVFMSNGDGNVISCTKLGNYTFGVGDNEGYAMALGYAALYNHSAKEENCSYVLNERVIIVTALRNIKKGEELLFNYGWDNDVLESLGIKPDQEG
jgi:SET domain-containing protein